MSNKKIEQSGENMNIITKLENWLKENHRASNHLIRTVFWLKEIYPEADETMEIAALAHDFERAVPLRSGETKPANPGWDNEKYLLWHGKRSAEFLEKYLSENNVGPSLIEKISPLVVRHETGGDEKSDAIKDADSISFLETQVDKFIGRIGEEGFDKESIRTKFNYMFNRISSEKARVLAKPFYEKAIKKLSDIS